MCVCGSRNVLRFGRSAIAGSRVPRQARGCSHGEQASIETTRANTRSSVFAPAAVNDNQQLAIRPSATATANKVITATRTYRILGPGLGPGGKPGEDDQTRGVPANWWVPSLGSLSGDCPRTHQRGPRSVISRWKRYAAAAAHVRGSKQGPIAESRLGSAPRAIVTPAPRSWRGALTSNTSVSLVLAPVGIDCRGVGTAAAVVLRTG